MANELIEGKYIAVEMKPVGLSLETNKEHFALALKMWRLRRNLTQSQAGKLCNVSRFTIMRVERADVVNWESLYKIMCVMSEDLK